MTENEVLAVQSTEFTERVMVIVDRPTYILHGHEAFDAIITATKTEEMEFLVGTKATFRVNEIIG